MQIVCISPFKYRQIIELPKVLDNFSYAKEQLLIFSQAEDCSYANAI